MNFVKLFEQDFFLPGDCFNNLNNKNNNNNNNKMKPNFLKIGYTRILLNNHAQVKSGSLEIKELTLESLLS